MKKWLALLLGALMVFSAMPMVSADEAALEPMELSGHR